MDEHRLSPPVRILQVIHQFPPHSSQGSEVYCDRLSRQLRATEDVRVFHVSNPTRRWRRHLLRTHHDGLPIYHCVDWGEYARVADWPNVFLRKVFQDVLAEFRPDIVHLHNYVSLGDDLPTLARASGAAVLYTLHDFGLICPNALLLRDDRQLCQKGDPSFFQDCCPTLIRSTGTARRTAPWSANLPSLARWLLFSKQYPQPGLGTLLRAGAERASRWLGDPRNTAVVRKRDFFFAQTRRIFRDVDLFLAPSDFLLQRYVRCGLPREKIVHTRYGMRRFETAPPAARSGGVRFGYIGALHPHKGIELLLEAFRGLGQRASLHVHGSAFGSPISQSYWQRIRAEQQAAVFFHGAYDNARIGEILADLDVIVVPSLWYENSPLTIQEAFIGGVPVITADVGGMAELVRDGVNGLHFRLGDATDLHNTLRGVIEHPEILDRLRRGMPSVPGIEEHTAEMLARYRDLAGLAMQKDTRPVAMSIPDAGAAPCDTAPRFTVESFSLEPYGARSRLHVAGWCFRPGQPRPTRLQLMADDRLVEEIACEQARVDVATSFAVGDAPGSGLPHACGFSTRVVLPADAEVIRLETVHDRHVLESQSVAALNLASLRFGVETFAVETFGAAEHVRIEGWCFTPGRSAPMTLQLKADGSVLGAIVCDQQRNDVTRAFVPPDGAVAEPLGPCGFTAYIPINTQAGVLSLETVPHQRVLAAASLDALRAGTLRFTVEKFELDSFGTTERLRVEGWCYARGEVEPGRLRLSADGATISELSCVREREDVARIYGQRESAGTSSLPRCGFFTRVAIPSGAAVLKLEDLAHDVVLLERRVDAIATQRWRIEIFRVDPPPTPELPPLLAVEGWLYRRGRREPGRVRLCADDETVIEVECGIERPDVEQAFWYLDDVGGTSLPRCGFRMRAPLPPTRMLRLQAADGTVLIEQEIQALLDSAGLGDSARFVSSPRTRWQAHIDNNTLQPHVREALVSAVEGFAHQPTFAILLTLAHDTDLVPAAATLRSLREQVYRNWELVIAAPPALRESAREVLAASNAGRVRIADGPGLTNAAATATAEWLCVLSAGDRLAPHALFTVSRALQEHTDTDLLYGDEDVIDEQGMRCRPSFKPVWSPTRMLSHDYIGRPVFVRRAVHDAAGGFAEGEHTLWLRLPPRTAVQHVAGILCHRVPWSPSDPVPIVTRQVAQVDARLRVSPDHGRVAVIDGPDHGPRVEIILLTRNHADLLRRCLESLTGTRYRPYSVTIVDDRSDDPETLALLQETRARGVKVLRWDEPDWFSFVRLNNRAVEQSDAELLLLLNNDTEVRDPRSLSRMVALLGPGVGAVGARLLYPDGTLQHAGVHLWVNGLAPGHELLGWPGHVPSPGGLAEAAREVAAVTAACLLTPRQVWRAVGGLDELFHVSLNDVDYCLRLSDAGWRSIYAGGAELMHHEAATRGRTQNPAELATFRARYARRRDPYCNANLEDGAVTPECRLDFAAFKSTPLRVSVHGSAWEASVVREALTAVGPARRMEIVADGADVVVAAGLLGYRTVNAATEAGRPVLWALGGPLGTYDRHVPCADDPAYRFALQHAAWVVFGSADARERSRGWQTTENFAFNRIAVPPPHGATVLQDRARCRVVWVGEGDDESDPRTFVRAFHRLPDGLPLAASWLRWGDGQAHARVTRAGALDERIARRHGRRLGPPGRGTIDALGGVDLFVSTGTGWDDPRPLLHATARGSAVLAPLECGLSERAAIGVNAWTYHRDDSRALAARMEALIAAPERCAALARSSRHVFGCLWTFDEMADRWADLLWGTWHIGSGGL